MTEPENYMNLPNWLGIARLTENEKLILNSQDAIPIVRIWEQKIVFDKGAIDDRFLKILCYVPVIRKGKRTSKRKLYYEPIEDVRIYKTFIEMTRLKGNENEMELISHKKNWYNYVDDIIDLNINSNIPIFDENLKVNPEYIYKMYETIKRHPNIIADIGHVETVNNSLSFIWELRSYNIVGFSFLINLIGYARDYMYEYKAAQRMPIPVSACEGRKGIKDCLYMIIEKIYPDFYTYNDQEDIFGKHFNSGHRYYDRYDFSEIMENVKFKEGGEKLKDQIEWELASKYDLWYKIYKPWESYMTAHDRVRRILWKNENERNKIRK